MQLADTLTATLGDLIANRENEPFKSVSKKHRCFSSIVHIWYSTANAQILGHNSITRSSSTALRSGCFEV